MVASSSYCGADTVFSTVTYLRRHMPVPPFKSLVHRLSTIADEAFGPRPSEPILTRIERGVAEMRVAKASADQLLLRIHVRIVRLHLQRDPERRPTPFVMEIGRWITDYFAELLVKDPTTRAACFPESSARAQAMLAHAMSQGDPAGIAESMHARGISDETIRADLGLVAVDLETGDDREPCSWSELADFAAIHGLRIDRGGHPGGASILTKDGVPLFVMTSGDLNDDDADLVTRGACTCVIAELHRQRESKKSHDGRRAERARRAIARLRRSP
jgi:hypothetical protein